MSEKVAVRVIRTNGTTYLRKEDVVKLLLNLAATEETDVRKRIELMAEHIKAAGEKQ